MVISFPIPSSAKKGECFIEVTTVNGLENIVQEECEEKLGVTAYPRPGRVAFSIKIDDLSAVSKLRCIEKFAVNIGNTNGEFNDNKESNLKTIKEFTQSLDWDTGLLVWKLTKQRENISDIKFRVSCNRSGDNHNFDSATAASTFGSEINELFKWEVDLIEYDIEILLNIYENNISAAIALSKYSLFRRNIKHFGHATLKPTIANAMLRLGSIKENDVLCDPMCGSGSIPIEGKICWPLAHVMCGDLYAKEVERTKKNINAINMENFHRKRALDVDVFQWDATRLPLRDEKLNVIVTDLPFGKRSGSRSLNEVLYPKILTEFARVLTPRDGRAVVLTADVENFKHGLEFNRQYFGVGKHLNVVFGGIKANILLLLRKCIRFK